MSIFRQAGGKRKDAGPEKKKVWSAGEFAGFFASGAVVQGLLWLVVKKDAFLAFSAAAVWIISGLVLWFLLSGGKRSPG